MTKSPRLTGTPIMRIQAAESDTLVGFLYQMNNGDLVPLWLDEPVADVQYTPMRSAA